MREKEWSDRVRKTVRSHFVFLDETDGWTFSTGGAASELVLRYSSERVTLSITISPMELPFLTFTTHEPGAGQRSTRFAASGDPIAKRCAKRYYEQIESGPFLQISEEPYTLIDQYLAIQAAAVRKRLAARRDTTKNRLLWRPI